MRFNSVHSASSDPEVYFDGLFRETFPNVVAYLEKISNNKELARDLAQEAYLKVWQKLELLPKDEEEALRYILIMSRNCFLDHLKLALKQKKQYDAYASTYIEISSASNLIEIKEQQQIIDHTINTHKEAARRFYLLNREEGLTYKEIALQEGVSEKTVERYIGGILRSLRSRLASMIFFW
ncbi:RNA polymerase sigma-70 factor, ECF subfamily [Chitinophaga sp. CF118]|uniref:sigma-70 family RNA polymerase sigma factor n=1 Tax=Chitinophaga sp. CF118 TaxID=1884367 RepID=UPI0008E2B7B9|nr:sigma-70 family RNA polymerase sigma factor [Chitinophaga sp. CF118]SFD15104.1 RNA polymerase sigma-70 factor, ECF subfamily [Chitinophaga sp. CF118]